MIHIVCVCSVDHSLDYLPMSLCEFIKWKGFGIIVLFMPVKFINFIFFMFKFTPTQGEVSYFLLRG